MTDVVVDDDRAVRITNMDGERVRGGPHPGQVDLSKPPVRGSVMSRPEILSCVGISGT